MELEARELITDDHIIISNDGWTPVNLYMMYGGLKTLHAGTTFVEQMVEFDLEGDRLIYFTLE